MVITRKSHESTRRNGSGILKAERREARISQKELADRLGVSQPLVSSWESGRIAMSIENVTAIELALDTELGSMLFRIAYPDNNPNVEA